MDQDGESGLVARDGGAEIFTHGGEKPQGFRLARMRKIEPVLAALAVTVMTGAAAAIHAATLAAAAQATAADLAIQHTRHADLFRTDEFTPAIETCKLVRPSYGRRSGLHGKRGDREHGSREWYPRPESNRRPSA